MTEVTSEIRIHMRHLRAAKICPDAEEFFVANNLNWRDFVRNGIPVSVIQEIGDPIALRAAAEAIKEAENGRRR